MKRALAVLFWLFCAGSYAVNLADAWHGKLDPFIAICACAMAITTCLMWAAEAVIKP